MSVPDDLAGLAARSRKAEAVGNVVQAALELLQQALAGHTLGARGLLKIIAELFFKREVDALGLLFLAELQAVAHDLGPTVLAVLTGREVALFDCALLGETLLSLE